jgi:hypothetical protein
MVAQTMYLKIWEARRELITNDQLRKAAEEAEEDELRAMEDVFMHQEQADHEQEHGVEQQEEPKSVREGWAAVKCKVPLYEWEEPTTASVKCKLEPDPLKDKLTNKVTCSYKVGSKTMLLRVCFPLRLWEPVAWWWQQLVWTSRAELRPTGCSLASHQVTFLELLVDFELATGVICDRSQVARSSWDTRAKLLRVLIKNVIRLRGGKGWTNLAKSFGEQRAIASLASFGAKRLPGLGRRPVFVNRNSTIRCIATNAWAACKDAAGEHDASSKLGKAATCYAGFGGHANFQPAVVEQVAHLSGGGREVRRRLRGKQHPG